MIYKLGPGKVATRLAAVLFITAAAQAQVVPGDAAPEADDRRVDVGGFELRARVLGDGSPVVVFDAGMADGIDAWRGVPAAVAEATRVVVYDRAGLGESDRGPEPRTARRVAAELHALLAGLGAEPPYVLVGHSLGGLNIRIFADHHADETAAFVFLDPATEGMHRSLFTEDGWRNYEAQLADYPPGLQAEARSLRTRLEELEAIESTPDVPAVLISGVTEPKIPEEHREAAAAAGITEERLRELQMLKLELSDALVAKFPRGRHVKVEASHYVHWDQSDLVVATILEVVDEVRGSAGQAQASQPTGRLD